uniref:Uncharacterized protein n=1 Tax=Solanum tuberosum TaxID=4113 RepID=M1C680_SOLTU
MAILGDLNQLKTESEEYKEMNQKLMEDFEDKMFSKRNLHYKERMEQELKEQVLFHLIQQHISRMAMCQCGSIYSHLRGTHLKIISSAA